jgi:transposase-like protein
MTADLDAKHFHDEAAAREFLEEVRWPNGPVCPHCGTVGDAYKTNKVGVYRCAARECRKDFTVRVGTLFERSHIALHTWLFATHLLTSSKKGMSSHQMHRMLGVTYKTAWFMTHRIREAMRELHPVESGPLGGANKVVEVDETYVGGKEANKHASKRQHRGRGPVGKEPVVTLVERDGKVRSFHVADVSTRTLKPILKQQIDAASYIMTDESAVYPSAAREFAGHGTVNHSIEEYVRGQFYHTNTVENYFSILKRGITGTYHHVSQAHLKRYVGEFDFRYNHRSGLGVSDAERALAALKGIDGKRLTYGGSRRAAETEAEAKIPF